MRCGQPGCGGAIDAGYCDICGMPAGALPPDATASTGPIPAAGVSVSPASTPVSRPVVSAALHAVQGGRPSRPTGRCPMPGCGGEIRDGYCDICGSPPDATAPPEDDAALSSITRGTTHLGSTALGVQRARETGTTVTRRVGNGAQRLRSARIGAGLTRVPPAPAIDPARAVLRNPVVPESRRLCPSCGASVGRARQGQPGRTTGFCAKCRNPFSFEPKLAAGDVVAGQYEVAGCLAHGGLGWIYLATDRNVSQRWVVLKGLLNSGDADATAAAIAEQRFLAQVNHPLLVEIYNFVTHDDAGYIVMEFVGGRSLKQLLKDRMQKNGGDYDPLPVDQALAYILEVLPAFGYLHDQDLVYCDFKPDNVIQVGDALTLIDLGGVRRLDDHDSAIFGTVGYQAPEVAVEGVSVQSDIFTIGRTLMVLCAEFKGYQSTYKYTFPPPETTPLFAENDSLYRLLLKCCAPDPADRFASADELRIQLLGVLRETVARRTRGTTLTSAASVLFEPPTVVGNALGWAELPELRPDKNDPQHGWLTQVTTDDPDRRFLALCEAPGSSPEVHLAMGRAALESGRPRRRIDEIAAAMLAEDPWEWRAVWLQGLAALREEAWTEAQAAFNAVYGQVPGELAAKLALAVACEHGGEPAIAEALYATCASTDANYVTPAAFGLARIRADKSDLDGVVAALDMVPATSREYAQSRYQRALLLLRGSELEHLDQALASVAGITLEGSAREELVVAILERALEKIRRGKGSHSTRIGEYAATEPALCQGLSEAYRTLARKDHKRRVQWIDRANRLRKWSLL